MPEKARSRILGELGLGEVPKGCVLLFQGPSGSGKTIMADNLVVEHLAKGLRAAVLTLALPEDLATKMLPFRSGGLRRDA